MPVPPQLDAQRPTKPVTPAFAAQYARASAASGGRGGRADRDETVTPGRWAAQQPHGDPASVSTPSRSIRARRVPARGQLPGRDAARDHPGGGDRRVQAAHRASAAATASRALRVAACGDGGDHGRRSRAHRVRPGYESYGTSVVGATVDGTSPAVGDERGNGGRAMPRRAPVTSATRACLHASDQVGQPARRAGRALGGRRRPGRPARRLG